MGLRPSPSQPAPRLDLPGLAAPATAPLRTVFPAPASTSTCAMDGVVPGLRGAADVCGQRRGGRLLSMSVRPVFEPAQRIEDREQKEEEENVRPGGNTGEPCAAALDIGGVAGVLTGTASFPYSPSGRPTPPVESKKSQGFTPHFFDNPLQTPMNSHPGHAVTPRPEFSPSSLFSPDPITVSTGPQCLARTSWSGPVGQVLSDTDRQGLRN